MPSPYLLIPAWYALASLTTFAAFALDKRAARLDRRRTPERTLHTLEALGGWPGAWLAIFILRHKNRKPRYLAVTVLATATHAAAWAWLLLAPASPLVPSAAPALTLIVRPLDAPAHAPPPSTAPAPAPRAQPAIQ